MNYEAESLLAGFTRAVQFLAVNDMSNRVVWRLYSVTRPALPTEGDKSFVEAMTKMLHS